MTNKDYIDGVLNTEADAANPLVVARLMNPHVFTELLDTLAQAVFLGQKLDKLKKHIFYGKEKVMEPLDYASRSTPPSTKVIRLLHSALGIATEVNEEIFQVLRNHLVHDTPIDEVNYNEEHGDIFWYLGVAADALGVTFEDWQIKNNAKLRKRYPEKFTEAAALNRDLVEERRVLEDKPTVQLDKIDELIQDADLGQLSLEQLMTLVLDEKVSINAARRVMKLPALD